MLALLSLLSSALAISQPPPPLSRRGVLIAAGAAGATSPLPAAAARSRPAPPVERVWKLAGGVEFPTLALNTAGLSEFASERALLQASGAGFTHVDFHPGIERNAVRASSSHPSEMVETLVASQTTKISKPAVGTSPSEAAALVRRQVEEDLGVLNVAQVDMLMLRDSPSCEVMQAQWAELERVKAAGLTRSIGVVNYCEGSLDCILRTAKEPPAVNYFMLHVGMGPDAGGLRSFGESRGIRSFAYGALGEPGPSDELISSPVLKRIGSAHGDRSSEEVALRWVLQNGLACSVRPTSNFGLGTSACDPFDVCTAGLTKRSQVFDWSLSAAEMAELNALTSPGGNPTLFSSTGCPNSFFASK
ncbi:MAG: hypothetical protein SGPRY_004302 [Prymnesium sp.]